MICRIGTQLYDILEYLHSRNVAHGDISIANVVDDGGQVSLIDFGLARHVGDGSEDFRLDHARTANVLIYLLYSGYSGKGDRPWYEELTLTGEQRKFLLEVMRPEEAEGGEKGSVRGTAEIKIQFEKCFGDALRCRRGEDQP